MERFIPAKSITEINALLPECYTAEQLELRAYLDQFHEQLCPLSRLTRAIFLWTDRRSRRDESNATMLSVRHCREGLEVAELSQGDLGFSMPDETVILVLRDDVSVGYLAAALGTEQCRKQVATLWQVEQETDSTLVEVLANVLLPRPGTALGQDLVRRMLASPSVNRAAPGRQISYLAPPFTEAEALANAVTITDSELIPPNLVDPASHFLYLEHLTQLRFSGPAAEESSYALLIISRGKSATVVDHISVPGEALRPVADLLRRGTRAWLNLPEDLSVTTGLPCDWARGQLRRALREAYRDLIKEEKSDSFLAPFDAFLEKINPDALFAGESEDSSEEAFQSAAPDYTLEGLGERLLLSLQEMLMFPVVRSSRGDASGPTLGAVDQQAISPALGSSSPWVSHEVITHYILSPALRALLEESLLPSIGDPMQRGTRPLLILAPRRTGKSSLLALLAAVASTPDALERRPDLRSVAALQGMAGKYQVLRVSTLAALGSSLMSSTMRSLATRNTTSNWCPLFFSIASHELLRMLSRISSNKSLSMLTTAATGS